MAKELNLAPRAAIREVAARTGLGVNAVYDAVERAKNSRA
jgi:hypothetical protein